MNNKNKITKLILILTALLAFFLDRISKMLIVNNFSYEMEKTIIKNFFSIIYVKNTGAAWSLFEGKQTLLIIISIIFLVFLISFIIKEKPDKIDNLTYGLIIGGIIGNLYDRITLNYVIDFIAFNIFGYEFPVFNLADSFIVIGVIILIINLIRSEKNDRGWRR